MPKYQIEQVCTSIYRAIETFDDPDEARLAAEAGDVEYDTPDENCEIEVTEIPRARLAE